MHGSGSGDGGRGTRDPRYERLRRLLVDNSSGVMLVMHLETRGFALALYASEEEALDACKASIVPEQPGLRYPPLRLRIVHREKPLPPEAVYTPNLLVAGEEVPKASLAITRGLHLVYRGRAVAKWCPRTAAGEDCLFGTNCNYLHKEAHQRTVRKRPRVEMGDVTGAQLSDEELAAVNALVWDATAAAATLVPPELQLLRAPSSSSSSSSSSSAAEVKVPVSTEELRLLCRPRSDGASLAAGDIEKLLTERLQSALDAAPQPTMPFFVRLSFPGGAPWDWALGSDSGLAALRDRCPLPPNCCATPLDRDLACQRVMYHLNQCNAFTSAAAAVRALACSASVAHGFDEWARKHDPAAETAAPQVWLTVRPWVYLPTVAMEASAFIERGGRRVRGIVQRYGQLRLMIAASSLPAGGEQQQQQPQQLAALNSALDTFTILNAERDEAREAALQEELQHHSRLFQQATDTLRRHIAAARLPSGAAWCAQLAIVKSDGQEDRVVVLSFKPYQKALEECPMYTHLRHNNNNSSSNGAGDEAGGKTEVSWNTQKHTYVPLFTREVLEKLIVVSK